MGSGGASRRGATFLWFVAAIFGFIVRVDHHGISSSVCWLRDDPYKTFLTIFRSDLLKLGKILWHWQLLEAWHCARCEVDLLYLVHTHFSHRGTTV